MTPTTGERRVLLVGLGTIGRTHWSVLSQRSDVEFVGGVDPDPPDWYDGARWPTLDAALDSLDALGAADLVVVATPTDTHLGLVGQLLATTGARVLSEKPLATASSLIDDLEARHDAGALRERLAVAHHFAFSPEVEWARALALREDWGAPTEVRSVFNDAFVRLSERRLASLVSSWVDSGPNQLSILAAFTDPSTWQVLSHTARRDRSVTTLDHGTGRTLLSSNWVAADTSKQTTVEYADGAVQLRLDHTSMTVLLLVGGDPVEQVGYAGLASRKDAHYQRVYAAVLDPPPGASLGTDPRLGLPLAHTIATVLEAAQAAPGDPGLAFSELTDAGS